MIPFNILIHAFQHYSHKDYFKFFFLNNQYFAIGFLERVEEGKSERDKKLLFSIKSYFLKYFNYQYIYYCSEHILIFNKFCFNYFVLKNRYAFLDFSLAISVKTSLTNPILENHYIMYASTKCSNFYQNLINAVFLLCCL